MTPPSKYPAGLHDRAVRMVTEKLTDDPTLAISTVCKLVSDQLGVNKNTLRNWVKQARAEPGQAPETTTADKQRIAELEKEVRELRQTNEFLWKFTANFAERELNRD